jgi:hydroxyacylglutathione hydrolase
MKFSVSIVSMFKDNYSYILQCLITGRTAVVDPAEPEKVVKVLQAPLDAILTTHHHNDHSAGNSIMKQLYPECIVYGGDDRIPALTHKLKDKETFKLGELNIKTLFTSGHTTGSISYYVSDKSGNGCVFTGDTLFIGGCGRFFEGTGQDMYNSLINTLSNLPDDTRVYCGHEYTKNNLEFASNVEPLNKELKAKLEWSVYQECTVPSTIGDEKLYNPFMRVNEKMLQTNLNEFDPVELMIKLRMMKNKF